MVEIININNNDNKKIPVLNPNFILNNNKNNPNKNIIIYIANTEIRAVFIIFIDVLFFTKAIIKPNKTEKIQNIKNFKIGGIGTNAIIKIMINNNIKIPM
jgi:hypothetical protein